MAYALAPHVKLLFSHITEFSTYDPSSEETQNCKKSITESFGVLIFHLRQLMLGYNTDEGHGLFKILEALASTTAWYGSGEAMMDSILEIIEELCNIRYASNVKGEEIAVGIDNEVETLRDQLTNNAYPQLQVISIAGTAGVGKTTLARTLYTDELIKYEFSNFRAWACVSQEYVKRNLLFDILRSFNNALTHDIQKMSDELLGEKLFKYLKRRKYLVILDDIWDWKAWNDIKIYFPDDITGSRILFTSRSHVGAGIPAHVLRPREEEESWEIFQKKVFRTGIFLHRLKILGREISNKCQGLPLEVVITAGLVKNKWLETSWRKIADDLHSLMVSDPSQYIPSLALSYNYMSPCFRPCFLFLGVFPENYDIPVKKLVWLWIAQGLIDESESKIHEDVAEDHLKDLIDRSMLKIEKVSAEGHIKACRIHDLWRDLCLRKAEEDQNLPHFHRYARATSSTITDMQHGISVNPLPLPTHSDHCYPYELGKVLQGGGSVFSEAYESLRILDVESIPAPEFPSDVVQLVNLRYLAIQAHNGSPHTSISNLVNLQMLVILSGMNVVVPKSIWKMVSLRHLYIKSGENLIEYPYVEQETEMDSSPNDSAFLKNLQTLSQVSPRSCEKLSSWTPNLRKLGLCGPLVSSQGNLEFPDIKYLKHLQKLKLSNTFPYHEPTRSCNHDMFPETLEKLTLSNTGLDWEQIWTLVSLPGLKVLKLRAGACIGLKWGTSDAKFGRLQVLKLHDLDLQQWDSWKANFPVLRHLVVCRCLKLNAIPSDIGNICTLEVIEVSGCSISAHNSAFEIQQEQKSYDNDSLKVHSDQHQSS